MKWQGPVAGVLALFGIVGTSAAQDTAFIVTRSDLRAHRSVSAIKVNPDPDFVQIGYPRREAVGLIFERVYVREATVDRLVSETPALPHLARVQMGSTTILVDPNIDYLSKSPGRIDENHSIIRAQRMFKALAPNRSYVVRGLPRPESAVDVDAIRPSAIIQKPNLFDKPRKDEVDNMPMIPAPQPALRRQMALVE